TRAVAAQAGQLVPSLAAIGRAKDRGVLDAGVNGVWIVQRRFQVPDSLEFPGVRRAIVPLMRSRGALVGKLVSDRVPGLAAIVGALDLLPEPAAALRSVNPVRIRWRSLHVVEFPATEKGTADVPFLSFAIGAQYESALARANQ